MPCIPQQGEPVQVQGVGKSSRESPTCIWTRAEGEPPGQWGRAGASTEESRSQEQSPHCTHCVAVDRGNDRLPDPGQAIPVAQEGAGVTVLELSVLHFLDVGSSWGRQ